MTVRSSERPRGGIRNLELQNTNCHNQLHSAPAKRHFGSGGSEAHLEGERKQESICKEQQ